MEILCPRMLKAAVAVQPPVSPIVMCMTKIHCRNVKISEHIHTLHWITEEHTVLQKYISRGRSRSDQYKHKCKCQPRTGHKGPDLDQIYSCTLSSTLPVVWKWVANATFLPLYHRGRHSTHLIGSLLGPRASLDRCRKFLPYRDSIYGPSSP
jgi:hypothetical protein